MKILTPNGLLLISIILITSCGKDDNHVNPTDELTFKEIPSFPGVGRRKASGFWIQDKFYVGLGFGYVNNVPMDLNDFYEFNSVTNTWTEKANFPGIGRESVTAFSINNKGYIGFGKSVVNCNPICTHISYKDLWEYDPSLNSWEKIATYDQIADGETSYSSAYEVNGKVYIIFGFSLWVFDPTDNSLENIATMPEQLIFTAGFKIGDRIYVGTGNSGGGGSPFQTIFYEFNTNTKVWTKKADFPGQARRMATGFALNNKGYISCGEVANPIGPSSFELVGINDTWQYDPVSNIWTEFKDYPGLGYIFQVGSNSEDIVCVGAGERGPASFYQKDFWIIK